MTKQQAVKCIINRVFYRLSRDHLRGSERSKVDIKKLEIREKSIKLEHKSKNIYYHGGKGSLLITFFLKDYTIKVYKQDFLGIDEYVAYETTLEDLKKKDEKDLDVIGDIVYDGFINHHKD